MLPSALDLTQIDAISEETEAHRRAVLLARNYFNGNQEVYLNDRAMEYLGLHEENPFRFNICGTIITALSDELNLTGFTTDEARDPEKPDQARPVAEWAAKVYADNKLDSLQDSVHEAALADSESFVIVEWDPIEARPKLIYNPYFIDTDVSVGDNLGDGLGCYFVYENDDPEQRPLYAVKRWTEVIKDGSTPTPLSRLRATLYYPDHFERWVYESGTWEHFNEPVIEKTEDGERVVLIDWRIDNTDDQGKALGIPVFHFKNKRLRPEHWDAIPPQDLINKTIVDIAAAGDLTAFQSYFGFGFFPTIDGKAPLSDGSNLMKIGPAQFNGTSKKPSDASLQVIQGQDSTFLMNQFKELILATAQITDTPASRFVVTAAIASDKTIKEQERGLKKKAKNRRGLFSDPWVGVFNMARKLSNRYGGAGLSEEVEISPVWDHTETLEELAEKKETLEIPIEALWREAGYTEEQVESMRQAPSYRVEFERKLWEGYNAASLNNIPLGLYLKRAGVSEKEIKEIEEEIGNQSGVTGEGL